MNLRWLFGNFTDPQYKLPRKEQFRLSNQAHTRFVTRDAFIWRTALIVVPTLIAIGLLKPVLGALSFANSTGAYMIGLAIILIVFWPWSAWMYRALYVVPIRKVMREAGYVLCLNCGYELRGLPADVEHCPECGTERTDRDTGA